MKIRQSARAILLNHNQIFLLKFKLSGEWLNKEEPLISEVWGTPGGGLGKGESFEAALLRELFEELGITEVTIGPWVWTAELLFNSGTTRQFLSHERYYLVRTDTTSFNFENMMADEKLIIQNAKWWNVNEILQSNQVFGPRKLGLLLSDLLAGNIPETPIHISNSQ